MDFSLMFWGDISTSSSVPDYYNFLIEVSKYADQSDYAAIWLPERHFHPWGGAHPNPSLLASVIASHTKKIRIRSGSIVFPLHHPLRIAEEWSLVDNLSQGRVELALATGWKDDDFVFAPEKYAKRKESLGPTIKTLQSLWKGEAFEGSNGSGVPIKVTSYPRPIQKELPIWVTSAGSLRSITGAGGAGLSLLTHLLGQDVPALEKSIQQYRAYRVRNNFKTPGKVALMLHTFIGKDDKSVQDAVRQGMHHYLMNSADLFIPVEKRNEWESFDGATKKEMIEIAFQRYYGTASLLGTKENCTAMVKKLSSIGVTDICCLVDFGVSPDLVFESLKQLTELKNSIKK